MSFPTVFHAFLFSCYIVQYILPIQSVPNIVMILTDDQDLELDSMDAMPYVQADIINQGITFTNAFATTPVCCPSRTETVAGRQYHNVQGSGAPCQGVAASYNLYENTESLFQKFHDNGYITAGFGKMTNDMPYCDTTAGVNGGTDLTSFDRVHVSCDYTDFYHGQYFNKYVGDAAGTISNHAITNDVYQTTMLQAASVEFISEQLQSQQDDPDNAQPFIMWIAPYAPHTAAYPAVEYKDLYNDKDLKEDANYNCDVTNHHPPLNGNPEINEDAKETMLLLYRNRLRTLRSVDDMVHGIVETIDGFTNGWSNTYVVYASDHGYHIGQYRLPCGKSQPYETTIRIPLYIRGPNVVSGAVSDALVSNIDFLPTFLEIAGISYADSTYDGRSMKNLMENGNNIDYNAEWRQILLFEYKTIKGTDTGIGIGKCNSWDPSSTLPANGVSHVNQASDWIVDNKYNNWRVLRIKDGSNNWMYGEFVDVAWDDAAFASPIFAEYFDINTDPFELNNVYSTLSDEKKQRLHALIMKFGECSGADSCSPIGLGWDQIDVTLSPISIPSSSSSSSSSSALSTTSPTTPTTATDSTSSPTSRGKQNKGNKGNAQSINGFVKVIDDKYNNNNNFGETSLSTDDYTEIALVLVVGIIAFGALGIGILIGKQLEKRPFVILEDNKV